MSIFLSILAAGFMIGGQSLWKKAISGKQITFSASSLELLFSLNFFLGALSYITATFLVIYLFSRYSFYIVQSSVLVSAIIFSVLVSTFYFKEALSYVNLIGFIFLLAGIALIYYK